MRYRLRTLLIVLALGPPVLAWISKAYVEYRERIARASEVRLAVELINEPRSRSRIGPQNSN